MTSVMAVSMPGCRVVRVSAALPLTPFPFTGADVIAVVSTRHGGVSAGAYGRLNLAGHVGDDVAAVAENRRRLAAELGVGKLTIADQQHTGQGRGGGRGAGRPRATTACRTRRPRSPRPTP